MAFESYIGPYTDTSVERKAVKRFTSIVAALGLAACSTGDQNGAHPEVPPVTITVESQQIDAPAAIPSGEPTTFKDLIPKPKGMEALREVKKPTNHRELITTPFVLNGQVYENEISALEACRIPSDHSPEEALAQLKDNMRMFISAGQTPEETELYDGYYDPEGPTIPLTNDLEGHPINSSAKMHFGYMELSRKCFGSLDSDLGRYLGGSLVLPSTGDLMGGTGYYKRVKDNPSTPTTSIDFTNESVVLSDSKVKFIFDPIVTRGDGTVYDLFMDTIFIEMDRNDYYWSVSKVREGRQANEIMPRHNA